MAMASTPSPMVDPEAAAIDSLSKRLDRMDSLSKSLDRMMRRMEEALARMDSNPATAATTVTATTTPSVAFTDSPSSPTSSALEDAGHAMGDQTSSTKEDRDTLTTTPPTSSPSQGAIWSSSVEVSSKPFTSSLGAPKVFDEMAIQRDVFTGAAIDTLEHGCARSTPAYIAQEEDDMLLSFLRVRDHRISKTSAKRLKYLKHKKLHVSGMFQPRLTTLSTLNVNLEPTSSAARGVEDIPKHAQPLQDDMTALASKPPPNSVLTQVVFDEMHQRYIVKSTSAYSVGVASPCLATKVQDAHKVWEGMFVLNSVLLEPWSAIVVDLRQEPSILNSEQVCILPKPSWSLVCLNGDSSQADLTAYTTWILWSPFKNGEMQSEKVQLRPTPWPSFDFPTAVQLQKGPSTNWHTIQSVKLCHDDRRLSHFAAESFLLVAQLLISLPVESFHAQVLGKPPWPTHKYHCNIFLCQNIQLCYSEGLPFTGDWVTAQQRLQWSSFTCQAVPVKWETSLLMVRTDGSVNMWRFPSDHVHFEFETEASKINSQQYIFAFQCGVTDIKFPLHLIATTRTEWPVSVTWLWQRESHLPINCSAVQRYSNCVHAYVNLLKGMSDPSAEMFWPQSDYSSVELCDSDQCELQEDDDFQLVVTCGCMDLTETDSILRDAMHLMLLWPPPKIEMIVLHFDARWAPENLHGQKLCDTHNLLLMEEMACNFCQLVICCQLTVWHVLDPGKLEKGINMILLQTWSVIGMPTQFSAMSMLKLFAIIRLQLGETLQCSISVQSWDAIVMNRIFSVKGASYHLRAVAITWLAEQLNPIVDIVWHLLWSEHSMRNTNLSKFSLDFSIVCMDPCTQKLFSRIVIAAETRTTWHALLSKLWDIQLLTGEGLQVPWDPGGIHGSGLRASRISSGGECHVLHLGWAISHGLKRSIGLWLGPSLHKGERHQRRGDHRTTEQQPWPALARLPPLSIEGPLLTLVVLALLPLILCSSQPKSSPYCTPNYQLHL